MHSSQPSDSLDVSSNGVHNTNHSISYFSNPTALFLWPIFSDAVDECRSRDTQCPLDGLYFPATVNEESPVCLGTHQYTSAQVPHSSVDASGLDPQGNVTQPFGGSQCGCVGAHDPMDPAARNIASSTEPDVPAKSGIAEVIDSVKIFEANGTFLDSNSESRNFSLKPSKDVLRAPPKREAHRGDNQVLTPLTNSYAARSDAMSKSTSAVGDIAPEMSAFGSELRRKEHSSSDSFPVDYFRQGNTLSFGAQCQPRCLREDCEKRKLICKEETNAIIASANECMLRFSQDVSCDFDSYATSEMSESDNDPSNCFSHEVDGVKMHMCSDNESRGLLQEIVRHPYDRHENGRFRSAEQHAQLPVGNVLNSRYVVLRQIGWGEFSTVWLAYDMRHSSHKSSQPFVAIKVATSAPSVLETTYYEMGLLHHMKSLFKSRDTPVIDFLDHFELPSVDRRSHLCIVMPLYGPNVLAVVDHMRLTSEQQRSSAELLLLKKILTSVLLGLRDLDAAHIIHTDVKPENILCTDSDDYVVEEILKGLACDGTSFLDENTALEIRSAASTWLHNRSPPTHLVCLGDFGLSAVLTRNQPLIEISAPSSSGSIRQLRTPLIPKQDFPVRGQAGIMDNADGVLIQTREYRAPEVLLGLPLSCRTDLWSVGCIAYELITGRVLFDPKRLASTDEGMDVEHLSLIVEVLGGIPREVATRAKSRDAERCRRGDDARLLPLWGHVEAMISDGTDTTHPLRDLSQEFVPYLGKAEADLAAAFVLRCLGSFRADSRPSATELLLHPFLLTL